MRNTFIRSRDQHQEVSWKQLLDKETYEFIFLLPNQSLLVEHARDGCYLRVACAVLKDAPLTVMGVIKGENILLDMAEATFARAWKGLPWTFRKNIANEDSVYIRFTKDTKKSMTIHEVKKIEPSKEEDAFARSIYGNAQRYGSREMKVVQG